MDTKHAPDAPVGTITVPVSARVEGHWVHDAEEVEVALFDPPLDDDCKTEDICLDARYRRNLFYIHEVATAAHPGMTVSVTHAPTRKVVAHFPNVLLAAMFVDAITPLFEWDFTDASAVHGMTALGEQVRQQIGKYRGKEPTFLVN